MVKQQSRRRVSMSVKLEFPLHPTECTHFRENPHSWSHFQFANQVRQTYSTGSSENAPVIFITFVVVAAIGPKCVRALFIADVADFLPRTATKLYIFRCDRRIDKLHKCGSLALTHAHGSYEVARGALMER